MRICSILLLLSGLVASADSWILFLDALTYGASVEFPQFFTAFVNAFAQAFLTEYGMLFSVPLVCLAVVLVVVNFWNAAASRAVRVLLPISMACTGFCVVLGARVGEIVHLNVVFDLFDHVLIVYPNQNLHHDLHGDVCDEILLKVVIHVISSC